MQRNDQAADSFRQKEIWFHTTSNGVVELLAQGAVEASSITSFRKGTETLMRKNSFSVYWMQRLRQSLTDKSWEEAMPTGGSLCLSCFGVSLLQTCFRSLSETGSWGTGCLCLRIFMSVLCSEVWGLLEVPSTVPSLTRHPRRDKGCKILICLSVYLSMCLSAYLPIKIMCVIQQCLKLHGVSYSI